MKYNTDKHYLKLTMTYVSELERAREHGGIKEALHAYENYVATFGSEPVLPALRYSPRQLFWISGASIWCSPTNPSTRKFAKASNCPAGYPMNPLKKCSVW